MILIFIVDGARAVISFCIRSAIPGYIVVPPDSTVWETPSPESNTIPVVRPEAYNDNTAWMATYIAGVLKVSNIICVIFSLLALGFNGASVSNTGCSSGATRSSL